MKDTLVLALIISFLILLGKASSESGLAITWEWDGVPHHHTLRIIQ